MGMEEMGMKIWWGWGQIGLQSQIILQNREMQTMQYEPLLQTM